ncbi:MAG: hypothetical protein ACYDD7_02565 [Acidimicrobiales bacterium]
MSLNAALARIEAIVDAANISAGIELSLPAGGRPRQLPARTLLIGILLAQADDRPAHLVRVHRALVALAPADQRRLGIVIAWKGGPHTLTYRQVERTFGLLIDVLARDAPPGAPSDTLACVVDALMEASIPDTYKQASRSLALDWTDHETFANPPTDTGGRCADPDATWGHRRGDGPGQRDELFFGYYPQAATMVADETGPAVPELARRLLVTTCAVDPPRALVAVLERLQHTGVVLGDLLFDSGYAHRIGSAWALPLRRLGARLVGDLHPSDRGPKGTHTGAIIANGNLYCPSTPPALLTIAPLARGADQTTTAAHDTATAETARYKPGRLSSDDADGYHRVSCPAVTGKLRCPLRPNSMTLAHDRPEILNPPEHPPTCCIQHTVTVPPDINAKTAQRHDYPGAAWRRSYNRRTAAERTFSTIKDPATTNTTRGWCRMMGLTAITLMLTSAMVIRNTRIVDAFETRQADDTRRTTNGRPPRTRSRRRRSIDQLIDTA